VQVGVAVKTRGGAEVEPCIETAIHCNSERATYSGTMRSVQTNERGVMNRSAGVTVVAVFAVIGSTLMLLVGVLTSAAMLLGPHLPTQTPGVSPQFFTVMAIMSLAMYGGMGAWGIATSIGLFRLKNWARISTIVFSVLLILTMGMGGLIAIFMPMPPPAATTGSESAAAGVRLVMGAISATLVAIGVWWVVFLTRANVVRQFTATAIFPTPTGGALPATLPTTSVAQGPKPPLRVTVLAWLVLVGSAFLALCTYFSVPAIFFTKIFMGSAAKLYFGAFAIVALYVGIGLLRLDPMARLVAIGYFLFSFLNAAVFYLAPGADARIRSLMTSSQALFAMPGYTDPYQNLGPRFLVVPGMIGLLIGVGIPLFILLSTRAAFERGNEI